MNTHLKLVIQQRFYLLFVTLFLFIFLISPVENSFAISPVWQFGTYNLNDGGVQGAGVSTTPVIVSVTDPTLAGVGTITIQISSSTDPIGFDLTLTEGPVGTFTNSNLALMSENTNAAMSSSVIITIWDDRFPLSEIQTLPSPPVVIFSDTDTMGLLPTFTETGEDTNIYTATINFGSTTDSDTNTLAAVPGDIFSVIDIEAGNFSHGFINPNPDEGKGGIHTVDGGTVIASYKGDSGSITIDARAGPGRGSGGLINPGLVLDSSDGGNDGTGGGCSNCTPPTLGLDSKYNRIVQGGFSYNGNVVDVEYHFTPYPLIKSNVGQDNEIVLKIFDDGGTQNVEHVGFAFGLGKDQSFSESKAIINFDRTFYGNEKTSVYDPENVLDNVKVVASRGNCNNFSTIQCLIVTIHHMFRDSLEFNMVSTNVWDSKKNAWVNFYNHGIEVTGDSLNPPKTKLVAFGEKEKRGLYELIQIDKKEHLWIDEFGNIFENKGNNYFVEVYTAPIQKKYDKISSHGCDRNCNWFIENKLYQELLAEITLTKMLGGKLIKYESLKEPFSHYYKITKRSEDVELQKKILLESKKAEVLYKKLFIEKWSHSHN